MEMNRGGSNNDVTRRRESLEISGIQTKTCRIHEEMEKGTSARSARSGAEVEEKPS